METEILKYILDNHGAVVTTELLYNLCDTSTLSEIICKNEKFVTCLFNGTPKIVVRSSVKLCWRKDCPGCGALHLCKGFFLTGSCPFTVKRRGCIFSHNIHSEYNERILREFELETLSRTQLCVLLLQSNTNLLPPICYNYNNRSGCQDSCHRLHICEKFLSQDCSCFRTHDFLAPQPLKLLQDRRIPDSLISSLKLVYANKEALHLADKLDSRRNRADSGTDSKTAIDCEYGCSQGTLNTGNDTNLSSNVRSSRGRGVQGRRGQFRGGRGNGGSRQDISSSDLADGSLSFVNGKYNFNQPGHEPMSTSDMVVDDGFDINSSNWGGRRGFGKGTNTGSRGRGGKGSLSNHFQSEGIHSQNDLLAAKKEVDFTNPKQGIDKRQRQGQRDKTEICMYFIKGHCKHEDRCFKAHDKMPYRWEIKQDGQWTHMAENDNIEQAYCDPANAYSTTSPLVYFDTMMCGEKEVRRLSTINSVLEPNFIHTTDWLWFWEDDHGKWLQYGAHTSVHGLASVTSEQLEEMCLNNNKDVVQFKAGSQSYELSFQDMIQTNIKYGTKRIVRRRPRFVSAVEVQTKRKRPTNTTTTFPDYWDRTQISPTEHRCISLQPSLGEYKEIHDLFCQTMKGFDILKIERIQNKAVWEAFQLHKNHLKNKNNGQSVAEKKLFHGTDPLFVNTICATNFDWRVCGVNGTAYGQGSYFARDAKYSHSYTGTSDVRFMFVSRVLVGEYTRGRSEYRRPPSKDGGDVNLYDSCVDNVSNPSIFVVFEKQQIYPEYVLQYRERGRQPATLPTVITPLVAVSNSSAPSVSTNALVTNPTGLSSTSPSKAVLSNLATTSTAIGSLNASVTHPITTSTANALTSKSATKSPTVSSNAFVTNPTTTFSTSSLNAFPSSPPPTSTRLSNTYIKYPTQSSCLINPYQTNPTTTSSIRSSNAFVTNPYTYTSDSSFRFAATLNPTTSTTRATSTLSSSSQRKKQSTCVVA